MFHIGTYVHRYKTNISTNSRACCPMTFFLDSILDTEMDMRPAYKSPYIYLDGITFSSITSRCGALGL